MAGDTTDPDVLPLRTRFLQDRIPVTMPILLGIDTGGTYLDTNFRTL